MTNTKPDSIALESNPRAELSHIHSIVMSNEGTQSCPFFRGFETSCYHQGSVSAADGRGSREGREYDWMLTVCDPKDANGSDLTKYNHIPAGTKIRFDPDRSKWLRGWTAADVPLMRDNAYNRMVSRRGLTETSCSGNFRWSTKNTSHQVEGTADLRLALCVPLK